MELESFIALSVLLCTATIIQSLTGFGFGLFVVTSVTLFTSIPVTTTAFIISALSLVNAMEMAFRHRQHIQWKMAKIMLCAGLPAILGGFYMLEWLSASYQALLMLVLGVTILACSLLLYLKKTVNPQQSATWQFALAGLASGLLGGLFSTFGPPVVFQCYKQPWPLEQVRATLLLMFCFAASTRLLVVPFGSIPDVSILAFTALAVPMVVLSTQFARRLIPLISAALVRQVAISLLALGGVALVGKAMMSF